MAVAKIDNWEFTAAASATTLTLTGVTAGSDRLIVCFVASEADPPGATAISIGGQSGEQISGSPIQAGTGAFSQVVSGWIIKETAIAARSNDIITITFTTAPAVVCITAAVFSGVDQTTPIIEYQEGQSGAATPNPIPVDITVDSVDNYVVACSGCGNSTTASWASPLTEQTEVVTGASSTTSVADLDPTSTGNTTVECTWASQNRAAIMSIEIQLAPESAFKLQGITRDDYGDLLGTVECYLFKDNQDDTLSFIDYTQSDSTGSYIFTGIGDDSTSYLVIGWKDDDPHVFDVTDHILKPIPE